MAGVRYYYQEEVSRSLPAASPSAQSLTRKLKTPYTSSSVPPVSRYKYTVHSTSSAVPSFSTSLVFSTDIILTVLSLVFTPQYLYIYYTMKLLLLFPLRWFVSLNGSKKHYFIFEFCAYTHYLNLFYLWSPWKPSGMFPSLFLFANGPVLCTVFFLQNGLILHSIEKMSSLFTHSSGALLMWSIKWYSPTEEGSTDVQLDRKSYESLLSGWAEIMMRSSLYYLIWAIYYSIIVLNLLEKRIIYYDNETSFRCLVQLQRDGFVSKLCNLNGERYSKLYYIMFHYTVTVLCMTGAFLSYYWKSYHFILLSSFLLLALHNGAKYYLK